MIGETAGKSVYLIAPSTSLVAQDLPLLKNAIYLLRHAMGAGRIALSPHLFTRHEAIEHVTASIAERSRELKAAIREHDIIVSLAGGTGAEDLLLTLDRSDYWMIKKRRPLFIGFSDFSFLLNEVYSRCQVPGILFPSLRLNEGNVGDLLALIGGGTVSYRASSWLADPPTAPLSGIPVGGNLTTFVNFLNRLNPPRLGWRDHVLFIEDLGIDLEDLHRLMAALRRHRVFRNVKALVIGSLAVPFRLDGTGGPHAAGNGARDRGFQERALAFIAAYLEGVSAKRRERGLPLPIALMPRFGHSITRGLPAVPVGGRVTLSPGLEVEFRLR